jgi:hypothetical protein
MTNNYRLSGYWHRALATPDLRFFNLVSLRTAEWWKDLAGPGFTFSGANFQDWVKKILSIYLMSKYIFKISLSSLSHGLKYRCVRVRYEFGGFLDMRENFFSLSKISGAVTHHRRSRFFFNLVNSLVVRIRDSTVVEEHGFKNLIQIDFFSSPKN